MNKNYKSTLILDHLWAYNTNNLWSEHWRTQYKNCCIKHYTNCQNCFPFLVYVDLGNSVTDTATLTFTFQATTGDTRLWEIKATQIICSAEYR